MVSIFQKEVILVCGIILCNQCLCFTEPDELEDITLPDSEKEVSDDDLEKSNEKKTEAVQAFQSGEFDNAIKLYTEGITLNPGKLGQSVWCCEIYCVWCL